MRTCTDVLNTLLSTQQQTSIVVVITLRFPIIICYAMPLSPNAARATMTSVVQSSALSTVRHIILTLASTRRRGTAAAASSARACTPVVATTRRTAAARRDATQKTLL